MQCLVNADQGSGGRVRICQQDAVLKTIFFGLRIELNGESHRRNCVLDVPAFLVYEREQSVNWRGFDFLSNRRFQRATGRRNIFACEIDPPQTHDSLRACRVERERGFQFRFRLYQESGFQKRTTEFRTCAGIRSVVARVS